MAEPLSPERFAVLAEQAGLSRDRVGAERWDELREGTRYLARLRRSVRRPPRERAAEPAHIFAPRRREELP